MRVRVGLVMVLGLVLLLSSPCRAQTARYTLQYTADAACPPQPRFEGLVDYYLEGEAPATGAHAQVTLREGDALAQGTFTLERGDGSRYTRALEAATCQEVAPALAFVLAYALSGRNSEPSLPSEAGSSRPLAKPPDVTTRPPEADSPRVDRAQTPRPSPAWRVGLGMALGARTGLGPVWTPVEAARVEARRRVRQGDPLVLAVVASALRDETVTRIDRSGTTSFDWLAGRLDLCPVRLELIAELGLLPCAGAHVGRLRAIGAPTPVRGARGRQASKLWVDAALATRLELRLWRVLALETQAELLFPFTPYRFAFDGPDTPVYQVPRVAAAAFVGLGVLFL
jgi:hypothetical protein